MFLMTLFDGVCALRYVRLGRCPYRARDEFRKRCARLPRKWCYADLVDPDGNEVGAWARPGYERHVMGSRQRRDARPAGGCLLWVAPA